MKTKASLVQCGSYEASVVDAAVRRSFELLGGIERFVKPGEKILLKPNLLSARQPERGVTTHPEVLRPLIRLVKEAGAVPVLGDSPGGAIKGVERVWNETGMKALARDEHIELINFETSGALEKPIDHPCVSSLHISKVPFDVDGIINVPKLKTHTFLTYTGAVKNFYGCVPGLRKAEYHKLAPHPQDFSRLLAEIYLLVKSKVRLTLMDGIVGMEGNGPASGDLRAMRMIAASEDAVALDSLLVNLIGMDPRKIPLLRYIVERNGGNGDIADIEAVGDDPAMFELNRFKLPANWFVNLLPRPPRFLANLVGKLIWMKPFIVPELCMNCGLCINSCPVNAIDRRGGEKPVVAEDKCISCLCCHELCPYRAIELHASALIRLFRKNK